MLQELKVKMQKHSVTEEKVYLKVKVTNVVFSGGSWNDGWLLAHCGVVLFSRIYLAFRLEAWIY